MTTNVAIIPCIVRHRHLLLRCCRRRIIPYQEHDVFSTAGRSQDRHCAMAKLQTTFPFLFFSRAHTTRTRAGKWEDAQLTRCWIRYGSKTKYLHCRLSSCSVCSKFTTIDHCRHCHLLSLLLLLLLPLLLMPDVFFITVLFIPYFL